jgi:hypothetical protein
MESIDFIKCGDFINFQRCNAFLYIIGCPETKEKNMTMK